MRHNCFSDVKFTSGGHLLIEDAEGSIERAYLEEGFFDFLDKVFNVYYYILSIRILSPIYIQ